MKRSRFRAAEMTTPSRWTICSQTSIWAPPAREPVSAWASEVSVPPVAIRTISFSWCSMKAVKGSCPRLVSARLMDVPDG